MNTVLIVIRDPEVRASLGRIVTESGRRVVSVGCCREARRRFPGREYDVVFAEARRGDGGIWGLANPTCQTTVLVGPPDEVPGDGRLPAGFQARLSTPFDANVVTEILDKTTSHGDTTSQETADALTAPTGQKSGSSPVRLLGASPAMRRLTDRIRCMAPAKAPVLIMGETGSGKELVARQLHALSPRSEGPFVAINCGALSPTLLESQLFGHESGSFTGAKHRHRGVFERAHGGTVFLDEITEMSVDVQVRLLRVLEQGTFRRIGGEDLVSPDFRTVAATNRVPARALDDGRLRSDLYYRLGVLQLEVPPLRDRLEDVELLSKAFLADVASEEGAEKALTPATLDRLREHAWPGNVRELRNAIYVAYLMSEGGEILPEALPAEVLSGPPRQEPVFHVQVGTSLQEAERKLITRTLHSMNGSKPRAAMTLGISLKTLYNRLKSYPPLPA